MLLHLPKAAVFEEIERNPKCARHLIEVVQAANQHRSPKFARHLIAGLEPAHRAPGA